MKCKHEFPDVARSMMTGNCPICLRALLLRLKNQRCWCEFGMANTNYGHHTDLCKDIRSVMEEHN